MNGGSHEMAMPSIHAIEASERTFLQRVFGWMTGGLALTGLVAWWASRNDAVLGMFSGGGGLVMLLAWFGLSIGCQAAATRAKAGLAGVLFVVFSAMTGLVLAPIFLVYAHGTIATAFFVTAGTFGLCTAYGMLTKVDLSKAGSIATMALLGLLLATLVNFFVRSAGLDWFITYALVLVFVVLTAWKVQYLKEMHRHGIEGGSHDRAMGIFGALTLYLSFINLFLLILKILGRSRD